MTFLKKKKLLSAFLVLLASVSTLAVTAQAIVINHITNGDFENGNESFFTQYTYKVDYQGNTNEIYGEGEYAIVDDPNKVHSSATSFGDHTSGVGLMMAVNGSTVSSQETVWSQQVDIDPNTVYTFSSWFASWHPMSPAELQISINDNTIGVADILPTTGIWSLFATTWNSGLNTSANIKIVDLNTIHGGNDFAIDDIRLTSTVPEPSSAIMLLFGSGMAGLAGIRTRRKKK